MAEKHSKAVLVHSSSVRELSPNALRQLLYVINFSLMHLEGLAMYVSVSGTKKIFTEIVFCKAEFFHKP